MHERGGATSVTSRQASGDRGGGRHGSLNTSAEGSGNDRRRPDNNIDDDDVTGKSTTGGNGARGGRCGAPNEPRRTGGRALSGRSTVSGSNGAGYGSPALLLTSQSLSSVDDDDDDEVISGSRPQEPTGSDSEKIRLQPNDNHIG